MAGTSTIVATGLAVPRRFTIAEYHRMAEAGILGEDDRVELIEGEIVEMAPIGRPHLSNVDILNNLLVLTVHGRAVVRVQGSVQLPGETEPQPDIVLLRWRDDFYAGKDAVAEDVLLIIEVADSSLAYDRVVKARVYAEAGIPDYWLWDVKGRAVTVHRDPGPGGYREVRTVWGQGTVSPLAFPDLVLVVEEVFPRAE